MKVWVMRGSRSEYICRSGILHGSIGVESGEPVLPAERSAVQILVRVDEGVGAHDIVPAAAEGLARTEVEGQFHAVVGAHAAHVLDGEYHFGAGVSARFEEGRVILVKFEPAAGDYLREAS